MSTIVAPDNPATFGKRPAGGDPASSSFKRARTGPLGPASARATVGQGTAVIFMCPDKGVQRYGTVAQVHGSWGCVRLRHNDRRWVLLDQLLPRGSLPMSEEAQMRLDREDDSDLDSESDGPPTCPPTPTLAPTPTPTPTQPPPAREPPPPPPPPPPPAKEGDDSDLDEDSCELCPIAAAVAEAAEAAEAAAAAAAAAAVQADDSDLEDLHMEPSPSPSERPSPRPPPPPPPPPAPLAPPALAEPGPSEAPLADDDDDDDGHDNRWGCSRCRWREKGCNSKRCRPKPGAHDASNARLTRAPIAKKKKAKAKAVVAEELSKRSGVGHALVEAAPAPAPAPAPEAEAEAWQPEDGDDAVEEPPAEQEPEHEAVAGAAFTDHEAERLVFQDALYEQRKACLKRLRPDKFPFFRARRVTTKTRPIVSDGLLVVPDGEVGYDRLLKFVANHHPSDELRRSTADAVMVALTARSDKFGGLESYLAYAAAAGKEGDWSNWCSHMTETVFHCSFMHCKETHRVTIKGFMNHMWQSARGIAAELGMEIASEE